MQLIVNGYTSAAALEKRFAQLLADAQ